MNIKQYLSPFRMQCILAIFCKVLEAIFELIVPLLVASLIDIGIRQQNSSYLIQMVIYLVVLSCFGLTFSIICQFYASRISQGVGTNLRNQLFHHILSFSFDEVNQTGASSLILKMTQDIAQIQLAIAMFIRLAFRLPFLLCGALLLACILDFTMTITIFCTMLILLLIFFILMKLSLPFYSLIQNLSEQLSRLCAESLKGISVIHIFAQEKPTFDHFQHTALSLKKKEITFATLSSLLHPCTSFFSNLCIMILLQQGAIRIEQGKLTQGNMIAFWNYMTQILLALLIFAQLVVIFSKAIGSMKRIQDTFHLPVQNIPIQKPEISIQSDLNAPLFTLQDVCFRYPKNSLDLFHHLNCVLPKQSKIAIVGGLGSGKSTFIHLLSQLFTSTSGDIFFQGINLKDYPLFQYKKAISVVPQKAVLFQGTIRDNLSFRKDNPSDQELWKALEIAQAKDFITQLPDKLDSQVTQEGKNFSGGQRQRLCIARSLVGDFDVLILDDSFSALDNITARQLKLALTEHYPQKSLLIISQKVQWIQDSDLILVFHSGKIIAQGTHKELLKYCEIYQDLCD
ncbi:multidrug ABC transporter ATP-binding protein [Clostridia bacterium]|nr:multidrug ABC transporter ATP-binding protein [Clostridia bacterium]